MGECALWSAAATRGRLLREPTTPLWIRAERGRGCDSCAGDTREAQTCIEQQRRHVSGRLSCAALRADPKRRRRLRFAEPLPPRSTWPSCFKRQSGRRYRAAAAPAGARFWQTTSRKKCADCYCFFSPCASTNSSMPWPGASQLFSADQGPAAPVKELTFMSLPGVFN